MSLTPMKNLYTIFYNDGDSDQSEVVSADEQPTEKEALNFINTYIEGDANASWVSITGVYPTAILDFNTGNIIKEN